MIEFEFRGRFYTARYASACGADKHYDVIDDRGQRISVHTLWSGRYPKQGLERQVISYFKRRERQSLKDCCHNHRLPYFQARREFLFK